MRLLTLIIGSALALSVVSVGHGQVQQPGPGKNSIVIVPNIERTLTISRSGMVLTTMNIPQGTTLLGVTFDTAENSQPANDGRFLFHGNVEIHVASTEKTAKLWDRMDQAPIQLAATGVDVAIAPR
jgi:hypothetical protein